MRKMGIFGILIAIVALVGRADQPGHNYVPPEGYVPTEEVAIKVAVAVWEPIYGAANIAGKKPFHARLANGTWTVEGSLPPGSLGGVPLAEIAKADGRILRVSHGK